jgi:formylglycine-generating enzyme required for sulfatase activity
MRKLNVLILVALFCWAVANGASGDTFGTGANTFEIEFVTIGSPGNAADTTGVPNPSGSVPYTYRMGKFEVSEQMIDKANTLGGLGITHDNRGVDKPATSVSWFEAATFVNWLNTTTGHTPAYKFNGSTFELWQSGDAGYNPANPFRNSQASYFLPSTDQWYKAAYYNPMAGVYYDYPTGSDIRPDGIDFVNDTTFDAVFTDGGTNPQPNDITDVGILSPYRTAGQGGNIWEWVETEFDLVNDSISSARAIRGGSWSGANSARLRATEQLGLNPAIEHVDVGLRVASIPEPSTALLAALAGMGLLWRRQAAD